MSFQPPLSSTQWMDPNFGFQSVKPSLLGPILTALTSKVDIWVLHIGWISHNDKKKLLDVTDKFGYDDDLFNLCVNVCIILHFYDWPKKISIVLQIFNMWFYGWSCHTFSDNAVLYCQHHLGTESVLQSVLQPGTDKTLSAEKLYFRKLGASRMSNIILRGHN